MSRWILLLLIVEVYVLIAPYTKVEESFNVQAVHDVLYHRTAAHLYDHREFPGVVPRTFAGALVLAAASAPSCFLISVLQLPKLYSQFAVRLTLGALSVGSFALLASSVRQKFGKDTAAFLTLITALQFHLPFYMSRPLPNIMAMFTTNIGLSLWIEGKKPRHAIAWLAAAAVVFRCDAILLGGLVGLHLLLSKQLTLLSGIGAGALASFISLFLTIPVDSWLWGRWLWPEGEVLWFNTVLNKSHEWGVSPPMWYFTSALPRALHAAYLLAPLGAVLDTRARPIFAVALGFVVLYSNLGHKELRFLFPVLPLWNISAAVAFSKLRSNSRRSILWTAAFLAAIAAFVAGFGTVILAATASRVNYPGGVALQQLHQMAAQHAQQAAAQGHTVNVHISVLPAMTGVSRFGEAGKPWIYSKDEYLADVDFEKKGFDYLLTDKPFVLGYRQIESVQGFTRIKLKTRSPLVAIKSLLMQHKMPIEIVTAPAVYIHVKNA